MVQIIGRVYRIVSSECDGCYIGSTTEQLNRRLSKHNYDYKRYLAGKYNYVTSFEVLKFVDAQIELIHEGVFDNKQDLEQFEGETIRTTPNAVNKIVVGRDKQQYRQDNRDAISAHQNTHCTCSTCGGKYTIRNKAVHCRTKKHQDAVSSTSSSTDDTEHSQ